MNIDIYSYMSDIIIYVDTIITVFWLRSRALKLGLIHLFFHPEQYFSLINSSSIPPNHPDSSRIQTSEHAHCKLCA